MVLDGLYIEDYKADVDDKEIFAFTYSNSSIAEPEAIKNNYSKSVTLKGTNNNNKIFGEIWNLDREIVKDGSALIGASFNPKQRASFKLYDNGELLESGYICLDNITINKGVIAYSITLFGSLGDFFYNLMYNENEEEKSLADLKLGLDNEPINTDNGEGKKQTLIQWTKDYINDSWDKLKGDFNEADKSPENWITAAPTYSGMYDDFDNDKVLVALNSIGSDIKLELLPTFFDKDGKRYRDKDGYGICTLQREFSEWETRDLRSLYQRPAIRTKLALDAISNPENNGGYEVVFDKEIKESPYYNKSFIVAPRLEWEDGYLNTVDVKVTESDTYYTDTIVKFNIKNKEDGTILDLNGTESPKLQLLLKERIYLNTEEKYEKISSCRIYKNENDDLLLSNGHINIIGGFLYKITTKVGEITGQSKAYFVTLTDYNYNIKYNPEELNKYLQDKTKCPVSVLYEPAAERVNMPNNTFWETDMFEINIDLIKNRQMSVEIEKEYVVMKLEPSIKVNWDVVVPIGKIYEPADFKNKFNTKITGYASDKGKYWTSIYYTESVSDGSKHYDGISSNVLQINVSKLVLFGNIGTPYKILTDFCKQFNLRFRVENDVTDERNGVIHIEQRKNYFIDEEKDISKQIDYSKDINIIPTTASYKFYKFGTENEDTYAYYLYKNRNADDYSSYTYNSNYNFNNDKKELFEDNIFNVGIDYRLNSPYFNTAKQKDDIQYPQICLTPKYEWKLWNGSESAEDTKFGLQSYYNISKIQDYPKMCLFDKDDKEVDMTVFCFFNGTRTYNNTRENNQMPYLLTDNLPIMNILNNDRSCYIYGLYNDGDSVLRGKINYGDVEEGIIGYWITELPIFSPNYKEGEEVINSFYFKLPSSGFTNDTYKISSLIYPTYWKNYIEDLYDENAKKVELYCFLKEKPQDALRKFYFFSNSIWVLNDITDYNYRSEEPVKCTFIKVKDKSNYLN